jgi:hypothetical protein
MRKGKAVYAPPGRTAEDDRCLINRVSTRVDAFGNALDEYGYERRLIERRMRLARSLGLTVVPGAYLPPPPSSRGAPERSREGRWLAAPPRRVKSRVSWRCRGSDNW